LADNRIITLDHVLVEWVEHRTGHVRVVAQERMPLPVAVPLRIARPPAVVERNEVRIVLAVDGKDARIAREADRWIHRREPRECHERPGDRGGRGWCGVDRPVEYPRPRR